MLVKFIDPPSNGYCVREALTQILAEDRPFWGKEVADRAGIHESELTRLKDLWFEVRCRSICSIAKEKHRNPKRRLDTHHFHLDVPQEWTRQWIENTLNSGKKLTIGGFCDRFQLSLTWVQTRPDEYEWISIASAFSVGRYRLSEEVERHAEAMLTSKKYWQFNFWDTLTAKIKRDRLLSVDVQFEPLDGAIAYAESLIPEPLWFELSIFDSRSGYASREPKAIKEAGDRLQIEGFNQWNRTIEVLDLVRPSWRDNTYRTRWRSLEAIRHVNTLFLSKEKITA